MKKRDDKATLLDIAQAASLIVGFVHGLDESTFLSDAMRQSAILHQLSILGEAVKRLSAEFRSRTQEIPWSLMAGMRDKVIHEYDSVDLEEVWRTATADIPDLLRLIEPHIPKKTS